ncbi:MAG: ComEC/Rec2 family competence protein [Bacteroidota bacterium]
MLKQDYIPTWLTFFLSIGIILGYRFTFQYQYLLILILALIILLIFSLFKANKTFQAPLSFSIISFVIFIFIGIITITIHFDLANKKHYSNFLVKDDQIIFQVDKILKSNTFYQSYWVNILQINNQNVKGKILVNILKDSTYKILNVDDILFTKGNIIDIEPPLNPFEFNYKKYLQKQQIYHKIKLENKEVFLLTEERQTIKGLASKVRNKINRNLLKHNFSEDQMAIINALLLGQRQNISKNLYDNYKNAGAVHILAISGLHIGIILLILNFLLKPIELIKNGKIIKFILLVLLLWAFAFLAGMSASIVRAVTMFTALAIGLTFKRRANGNNALVISMFFLLLFHPIYLFDVGFQMSYLAVFFIINLQPVLVHFFHPKQKLIRYFWQLFTVTIAAQIGVVPLSLYYFHQFPGLFFISSMVIIPFLGTILGFGFLILFLVSFEVLPVMFVKFYALIINTLNSFISFIAHQESFLFQNIPLSSVLTITIYLALFSGLVFLKNKIPRNLIILLLSMIIIQGVLIYEKYSLQTTNEFVIFNKKRSSLIIDRSGAQITILQDTLRENSSNIKTIRNFKTNIGKLDKIETKALKNIFIFNNKNMLIIDSSTVYINRFRKPELLLLRQSPKINFERMIKMVQPLRVIVDGSNYKSYIQKWEKTCKENDIIFYNTSKEGAFVKPY